MNGLAEKHYVGSTFGAFFLSEPPTKDETTMKMAHLPKLRAQVGDILQADILKRIVLMSGSRGGGDSTFNTQHKSYRYYF